MAVQGLSGLDAAFLAAETPANPLHVMAAMVLDPSTVPGGYSFERFRDDIGARLGLVPRLHRRLNEVPFAPHGAVWVEDAGLDLGYHIRPATLPAPAGQRELAAFVAGLAERSLDRARPLWELHVIEGLEHGHIAVVAKLHHALMDGIAGMELMAALFSVAPDSPPFETVPVSPEASPGMLTLTRVTLAGWLLQQPAAAARAVAESTRATMRVGRWLLLGAPRRVPLPFRAPRMGLGRVPTAHRVMACTSVALADVREISSRFGVTVNDVVLASLGGALRQVLVRRNELPEASLVAAVPVSVHDGDGFGLATST